MKTGIKPNSVNIWNPELIKEYQVLRNIGLWQYTIFTIKKLRINESKDDMAEKENISINISFLPVISL